MQRSWETLPFDALGTRVLYAIMRLRQEVFVEEQNSPYLDADGADLAADHMLCREAGELVAYQRLIGPGIKYPESSMGRIVVRPALRGQGLGAELVRRGIAHNLANWPGVDICISAQAHLEKFYGTLGFTGEGEIYDEDGIPHRKMRYRAP
ncbi:MAG: GNAT family N-acetyltransferase [Halioglobus sp.]|nr:GNAT family N-acetyltransferase [Halioglobus sp.]